jgi:hypothetical protein
MDKIYIVTAGDSFTDSHIKNVDTQNSISVYNVVRIFDDTYGLSQPNFM